VTANIKMLTRRYVVLNGLCWLPTGLCAPVLVLLLAARGLDIATIGAVLATYGLTAAALEPPTGGLADVESQAARSGGYHRTENTNERHHPAGYCRRRHRIRVDRDRGTLRNPRHGGGRAAVQVLRVLLISIESLAATRRRRPQFIGAR
jgi:hypothetical protein